MSQSSTTSTNSTSSTPLVLNGNLFLAYTAIVLMALAPIYLGSFLSLKKKKEKDDNQEVMTKKDAYMYPVYGSAVLFGLYLLFRFFSKEYINLLLTSYFLFFGYFALVETFNPVVVYLEPVLKLLAPSNKFWVFQYRFPWQNELNDLHFNIFSVASWSLSLVCLLWYTLTKNWLANNLLGLSFSLQGVSLISLGSYQVGCILLSGLFLYDIFWVFGTDVMVTVAKSFDAPIKLLFPKSLFAETYSFSMLGLGDIVIPGIFLALLCRYDAQRAIKPISKKPVNSFISSIPSPYFHFTFVGYALGLILTIFIMHTFQAAQPALLYLVPACIGVSLGVGFLLGDFHELWAFKEEEEEKEKDKNEKNETNEKNEGNEKNETNEKNGKKEKNSNSIQQGAGGSKKETSSQQRSATPNKKESNTSAQRSATPQNNRNPTPTSKKNNTPQARKKVQ